MSMESSVKSRVPEPLGARSLTVPTDCNRSGRESASPSRRLSVGIALTPIPRIVCNEEAGAEGDGTQGTHAAAGSPSQPAGVRPVKLYKIDCGGGLVNPPPEPLSDPRSQRRAQVLYAGNKNPDYHEESEQAPSPIPKNQYSDSNSYTKVSRSNTSELKAFKS
jgi:hypothetical protein